MVNVWLLFFLASCVLSSDFKLGEFELTNAITPNQLNPKNQIFVITGCNDVEDGEIIYKEELFWDDTGRYWRIKKNDRNYKKGDINTTIDIDWGKWDIWWDITWDIDWGKDNWTRIIPNMKVMVKPLEKMKVSEETMKANDMIIFNIPENQSLDGKHGTLLELHADGKWLVQVLEEKDRQVRAFPARLIKEKEDKIEEETQIDQLKSQLAERKSTLKESQNEIESYQQTLQEIESSYHKTLQEMKSSHQQTLQANDVRYLSKMEEYKKMKKEEINQLKSDPYFDHEKLKSLNLPALRARETNTTAYLNKIKDEIQIKEEQERLCVICMEKERDHAIIPCGHYCLCESCANKVSHCPICRGNKTSTTKIYKN